MRRAARPVAPRDRRRWSGELVEETGIRSLKIRHNNVLGYFIEVTANHQAILTGSDAAQSALHPSPDHGQRHALHHHRARRAGNADRQRRRPGAGDRARVFERLAGGGGRPRRTGSAPAPRRSPCSTCRRRSPCLPSTENYCRPVVDDSLAFEIEGGRHPVVEQALRRQAAAPSSPMTATCRRRDRQATARSGCSPAPTWAASRPSCARTR